MVGDRERGGRGGMETGGRGGRGDISQTSMRVYIQKVMPLCMLVYVYGYIIIM